MVFGTLAWLLYRDAKRSGQSVRLLPIASTMLALAWDLALLLGLAFRDVNSNWANAFGATAFAALSILPAVLLDLSLARGNVAARAAGYTLSAVCALLHLSEIAIQGPDIHGFALIALSAGFAALTLASMARARAWNTSAACVLALSATFLHFRGGPADHSFWSEVLLHHAGIPVALYVVLRDYRFLLLDAFLRLAANGALAALFVSALWAARATIARTIADGGAFAFGLLLVAAALVLIGFSMLRERLQRWLTRQVFLRRDPGEILRAIPALQGDEQTLLERSTRVIAEYFRAPRHFIGTAAREGFEATAAVKMLKGDVRFIQLGGRRFLSEDLEALDHFCEAIAREVDRARADEMERLMVQAELRALQAQIHPHFLFNALNALYGSIPRQATDARHLVVSLSELFRYFLTTGKTTVRLEEELAIIEAYLEIEKARLGSRLTTTIDIPDSLRAVRIPILSVEPLVENAVKHGVAAKSGAGHVRISALRREDRFIVRVEDDGPGLRDNASPAANGVGLENVRRRVELEFGPAGELEVRNAAVGVTAELRLPVDHPSPPARAAEAAADRMTVEFRA
jgi:signal transduction histidine kinase